MSTPEEMLDLNDLRVFAYVASLASFSLAAGALNMHKSSVSRRIARLESALHTPLIERSGRAVSLTLNGIQLKDRCDEMLAHVNKTIGFAGGAAEWPCRRP